MLKVEIRYRFTVEFTHLAFKFETFFFFNREWNRRQHPQVENLNIRQESDRSKLHRDQDGM
jgi:hypothetical protein